MQSKTECNREVARLWQLDGLDQLELLKAQYVEQVFPWHYHNTYCIGVLEAGSEVLRLQERHMHVQAGSIILINPAQSHTNYAVSAQGWSYRMFYPTPEHLQYASRRLSNSEEGHPYFRENVVQHPVLFKRLLRLHHSLEAGRVNYPVEEEYFQVLAHLVACYATTPDSEPTSVPEWMRAVEQYITEHLMYKITLNDLSRVSQLSPFHLIREFKAARGVTPFAYLTLARIEQAKELLSSGESLSQAAYLTNFFDQSHFHHHFKRIVGVTPGQYQQMRKK